MTNKLLEAIEFAKKAHEGQIRKWNGRPYITHPLEGLLSLCINHSPSETEAIVMVLHDVLEDCKQVTEQMIKELFGLEVLEGVKWLTNPSKQYPDEPRHIKKKMDRDHIAAAPPQWHPLKATDRIVNVQDFINDVPLGDESPKMLQYAEESRLLAAVLRPNIKSGQYGHLMDLIGQLAVKHTTYRPT